MINLGDIATTTSLVIAIVAVLAFAFQARTAKRETEQRNAESGRRAQVVEDVAKRVDALERKLETAVDLPRRVEALEARTDKVTYMVSSIESTMAVIKSEMEHLRQKSDEQVQILRDLQKDRK